MTISDKIAEVFGITQRDKQEAVENLFYATESHPLIYWMQLFIAAAIAQLGLVLDSTAVIIGAMLVSPLMTPIVQVGMSFTMGNLYFSIKSFANILASIVLVVGVSALMTLFMPFQEVTSEILTRTQPTALDLIVALFCGLAASFTFTRGSKDTMTAAAGTAIAIALVPPLSVAGFGLGIKSPTIFWGAIMLFTANFSAILLVTDVFFLLTGFTSVNVNAMEEKVLDEKDTSSRLFKWTKNVKAPGNISRWKAFRLALPILFVMLVVFPLSQALKTVAWEINVKNNINKIITEFEKDHKILSRYEVVSHGAVGLRLTIVGKPGAENELTAKLRHIIGKVADCEPDINLEIVPSSEYMKMRLEKSNEWFSEQVASLKMEQLSRKGISLEDVSKTKSAVTFRKKLRQSLEEVMSFLSGRDEKGQWIDWSVEIGKNTTIIHINRIANEGLTENEKAIMAGVIQRETELPVVIQDGYIKRTIFKTTTPAFYNGHKKELSEKLADVLENQQLGICVVYRDLKDNKKGSSKNQWKKMNELLGNYIGKIVPSSRLTKEHSPHHWDVHLVPCESIREKILKEKTNEQQDGQNKDEKNQPAAEKGTNIEKEPNAKKVDSTQDESTMPSKIDTPSIDKAKEKTPAKEA